MVSLTKLHPPATLPPGPSCLPLAVPIDLSNVCFDGGRSPDRLSALSALAELARTCPGRTWRLIQVDATLDDVDRHR